MRFIQYMHPAAQARTDASGLCPANPGPRHQRKFFQVASGHWQAAPHAPVQEGPLAFWGSWEQATRYTPLPASSDKAAPVAAHQPVLSGRARHGKDAVRALPTHPFVFDAPFLFLPGKFHPIPPRRAAGFPGHENYAADAAAPDLPARRPASAWAG